VSIESAFRLTSKIWSNANNPLSQFGKALRPSEKSTRMQQTSQTHRSSSTTTPHQHRPIEYIQGLLSIWTRLLVFWGTCTSNVAEQGSDAIVHNVRGTPPSLSNISRLVCMGFHTVQLQWKSVTLHAMAEASLLFNWANKMSSHEVYPTSPCFECEVVNGTSVSHGINDK
jgi:hypothetical protein